MAKSISTVPEEIGHPNHQAVSPENTSTSLELELVFLAADAVDMLRHSTVSNWKQIMADNFFSVP